MLNFRKLKQDFTSEVIKKGRDLYQQQKVTNAKILYLDQKVVRVGGAIQGQYEHYYQSEIEINRSECETVNSECSCTYNYECQHVAALIFHLEEHLDAIMVQYSQENNIEVIANENKINEIEKQFLIDSFKTAITKQSQKEEKIYQQQLVQEYIAAADLLSGSPFFRPEDKRIYEKAEGIWIFSIPSQLESRSMVELQLVLAIPSRLKPLPIPNIKKFMEAIRYEEPIFIGNKKYYFSLNSFEEKQREILQILMDQGKHQENPSSEKGLRILSIEIDLFGAILSKAYQFGYSLLNSKNISLEEELPILPGFYHLTLENPLRFSPYVANLKCTIEYLKPPISKILIRPTIAINKEKEIAIEETILFYSLEPGVLHQNSYYKFPPQITRLHLKSISDLLSVTIPEPLFGTFVENSIPQLALFSEIENLQAIESFVTLPYTKEISAFCELTYLDNQLEANLLFYYDQHKIPVIPSLANYEHVFSFVSNSGINARNLVEERKLIESIFQDFSFNIDDGSFFTKSEKKIIEFMTEIIPKYEKRIHFKCPHNLLELFIYDQTKYNINLLHTDRIDLYQIDLQVSGSLLGIHVDLLRECLISKRNYIELGDQGRKGDGKNCFSKILILNLSQIATVVQLFDELDIIALTNQKVEKPLWNLSNIDIASFQTDSIKLTITEQLKNIREQMLGNIDLEFSPIPEKIQATLRPYQNDGVHWLERLRRMYLNGILADDMGLGKTLQAIVAIAQYRQKKETTSLIVCPTSLLYNWKEECSVFHPELKVLIIEGNPMTRKRLIEKSFEYDVIITSYTLLQKDIEIYKNGIFGYLILDEAQHIKNRGTRNARSVKTVRSEHRLILSGTPIENSLDEMWSLFDFLMPNFLGPYERFIEKYIRISKEEQGKNLEYLRKKVAPFILRRMKSDVLKDLPPISEIIYHCQLAGFQKELYQEYAETARNELVSLVEKEGFDRVQIHVLATLTRLKQICCHPAIFAKEKAETGDSAKYEMLVDLVQTLIAGKHKIVIFSQYTRMLQIMREDFQQKGIVFTYLDGSTKNRTEIIKTFNQNEQISVFLVSLKAGGTGLNIVGADTVIHYDIWWNPAVENQATDRVYRIGQSKNVSVYKLITLGTIEERIAHLQKIKKGLVNKVISCDDEAVTKLTWQDILELLRV